MRHTPSNTGNRIRGGGKELSNIFTCPPEMFLEHFSGWRGDLTGHHWLKLRRIFHITFDVIHKIYPTYPHGTCMHTYLHFLSPFLPKISRFTRGCQESCQWLLPIVFIGQTLSYSFQTFNLRFIPVVVPINQESIVWPNNKLHLNLQQTIFV